MAVSIRIEGLEQALNDINEAIADVKDKSQAAFWEVGLKVLNKAMKNLRDSVVTGNLRASGYARQPSGEVLRPDPEKLNSAQSEPIPGDHIGDLGVEVGFTAIYALNVHENIAGARTPKFLERPVMENKNQIIQTIKSRTGAQ